MGDLLDHLDEALEQAPKFGVNARALILQAALTTTEGEEEDAGPSTAAAAAAAAQAAREAAEEAAARRGGEYLGAVQPKERPLVAYLPRAKFARAIRQTVLNRLVGQHLALAAFHAGGLPPAALATDCELRQQAFATALAQEADLYQRCATGQVYQNLAARNPARAWDQPQYPLQPLEDPQPDPVPDSQQMPAAAQPGPQQEQQGDMAGGGSRDGQDAAAVPPPAKRHKGAAGGSAPQPGQLLEVDLDWEGAEADDGEGEAAFLRASRRQQEQQRQGRLAEGAAAEEAQVQQLQEQSRPQQQPTSRPAPPPAVPPTLAAAPTPALELARVPAAGSAAAGGYAPSEAAPAAAADGAAASEPGGAGEGGAAGAAAPAEPAVQGAEGGGLAAAEAGVEGVRQEVELFIQAELEPLLRRGQLSRGDSEEVLAKCVSKVMQRHAGARSSDFLAREGAGISKLVAQYVEYVTGRRR